MKLSTPDRRAAAQHLFVGGFGFSQRDVVAQFSEEQVDILHRKTDAGAQISRIILSGI